MPQVEFQIASYDVSKPLIIDPVLSWATYLGGSGADIGVGIAVDTVGNAYITGTTASPDFPGTASSPIQSTHAGGGDVFVTKLNAAGTAIVYSTYLGSFSDDDAFGIAVDAAGNAYVTGGITPAAGPLDFPGTAGSSIQPVYGGSISDGFVTKLNATGTAILYSTFLGGSDHDRGRGIAVDAAGNAYVTGETRSSNFPGTEGSLIQGTIGGNHDVFVTKVNVTGTAIIYSTYLGGSGVDHGFGIAVDAAGNAYVTGDTSSFGFPGTADSLIQSTYGGGSSTDGFVTKVNEAGTAILYSTYLGGSSDDTGKGIAVDAAGNAYITGTTGGDAFVTKVNAAGTAIVYSTNLGGSGEDQSGGIAVDTAGNAYVTGRTSSGDFPGTAGSLIRSTYGGNFDAFVAKITNATAPTCSAATAMPAVLGSPNHQFVSIAITGITNPNGGAVTITVTGVTQDEPVNAKGDGNTSPDAVIQAGAASVRAERSGKGNGRVYELSFKADDGQGGVCTGTVKVGIPHSLQKGAAIDDGQVYDSTVP